MTQEHFDEWYIHSVEIVDVPLFSIMKEQMKPQGKRIINNTST